jgi:predicted RNase H-like HicB family nuclease
MDFPAKLTAVFEPDPEGGYTSRLEELPEVFSEGETIEEASANLQDALKLVLEYHRDEAR